MIVLIVYAVEFVLLALVLVGTVTQVIVPLWKETPMFPMFRKERSLERELTHAKGDTVAANLERELTKEEEKARAIRRGTSRNRIS